MTNPGDNLSERTVVGSFWVLSLRIIDRVFQLARTVILARLLSPDDFGLFGIALLVLSALETFSESGFNNAIIQKKRNSQHYLDTAWTIGIIRGFLIAFIIFGISKPVAIFFGSPLSESILKIIGISIVFQSLSNIAVIYFQKELEFHKLFIYQFSGTIADVLITIVLAIILKNVWALIFGLLAGNLIRCILSYLIIKYRPRLRFEKEKVKELFKFGRWILISTILMFIITHGDDFFVGKVLGITMLGYYQMAYRISSIPSSEISRVVSQVSFPAYSKLQDEIDKLRGAYLKILRIITFISFPLSGLIFVLAPEFTVIFLGNKWVAIITSIQMLVIWGLIRSIGGTIGPIIEGIGKPKILSYFQAIQFTILVALIYPLTIKMGIFGTSIAVVISAFISNFALCFVLISIIRCSKIQFFRELFYPAVVTGIFMGLIYLYKCFFPINNILIFSVIVIFSLIIYFSIFYLIEKIGKYRIFSLIKETIYIIKK